MLEDEEDQLLEEGAEETGEERLAGNALVGLAEPDKRILPRDKLERLLRWADPRQTRNICDDLDDEDYNYGPIGNQVIEQFEIDDDSRSDWLKDSEEGMKLAQQQSEPKSKPWPGSSNVVYPLVSAAATQFAARAYPAIVSSPDVVKGVVVGNDDGIPAVNQNPNTGALEPVIAADGQVQWREQPGEKRRRADRIAEHMSWQLLEEQPEWEEETDRLLTVLPIVGCEFRKTFFDPTDGRNVSVRVSAKNLVVNYWAKSLETAPRISEVVRLYPYEIEEMKRAGLFRDVEYVKDGADNDPSAPIEFIEQHRRLDLDNDGYEEPYIVTVHRTTGEVARIIARYDPHGVMMRKAEDGVGDIVAKIQPIHYYTKYDFLKNPDGGIYGKGFGHYLGSMNTAINTSLNMMFDAGHLQNTGGGFVGKSLSMHSGELKFKLGEWKVVNALGQNIRDAIVPLQWSGPSAVLFNLLGLLIEASEKLASVNEVLTGQQTNANEPAATTLARIEQGLKVFTSIYKRVHKSLKSEYDKCYRLNRIYLQDQASYRRGDEWRQVTRKDYQQGSGVEPISDPAMVSDMQQLARAEMLKEWKDDPLCDGMEIRRRIFSAAKLADIDRILKPAPAPNPAALLKAAEIKVKETEAATKRIVGKAQAVAHYAAAIKALADADAVSAGTMFQWVEAQMNVLRTQIESLDDDTSAGSGDEGGGAADGPRSNGGPVPGMATIPGQQGGPPVPSALRGGAAAGAPSAMGV